MAQGPASGRHEVTGTVDAVLRDELGDNPPLDEQTMRQLADDVHAIRMLLERWLGRVFLEHQ